MDWAEPIVLLLMVPAAALVFWFTRRSLHPMHLRRRHLLLAVRCGGLVLILLALAGPAWRTRTDDEAVIFVMDHSHSQGEEGMRRGYARVKELARTLPSDVCVGVVSAGESAVIQSMPERGRTVGEPDADLMTRDGAHTDLEGAVALAAGLFPSGTSRRLVLVTDGLETRGDVESAARNASLCGVRIDALPVAGQTRPDVRVVRLVPSRSRLHEGASVSLLAEVESSVAAQGLIRLFENGVEVASEPLELSVGEQKTVTFRRTPAERSLYRYHVRLEGFQNDAIAENNESMTLVDVRGRPMLLYVEGEPDEARYLGDAMAREGIRLHRRPPQGIPETLTQLAGYDGVILSDVPAFQLSQKSMTLIHDYVEKLGGGFLMIGGKNSFGVGGYYRTPIEEILPVKIKAPDIEERHATALVLVIDRSGSMQGQKVEICKSAAIATVELLTGKDYLGVVAFDSNATWIVPMTRASSQRTIAAQIATINAGGGTNIYPAMSAAHKALTTVKAKVKHMIVLSDGQTTGSGYPELAARVRADGITISTVAIGRNAAVGLLQAIAAAGGGQAYATNDPTNIPRIFTQDAMVHMGRLIREEAFAPKQVERHAMLTGWPAEKAPQLLGYVRTNRKVTAQVPLVTEMGDPLLAHWRFGLGKVTAFTSDCKSRWASLWISGWREGYSQFWAQVLREMAREPQGRLMDIRLEQRGNRADILVDVLEDAAQFRNEAEVQASVYFVPAGALGSAMQPLRQMLLEQKGPGFYEGHFTPTEPGVYLVRARSEADLVSTGLVYNVSGEAATGRVNTALLEKVCKLTGGTLLSSEARSLPETPAGGTRYVELSPGLLKLLLLLFVVDLAIRRWENLQSMIEWFRKTPAALRARLRRRRT